MNELLYGYYVPNTILDIWNVSKILTFAQFTLDGDFGEKKETVIYNINIYFCMLEGDRVYKMGKK